MKKNLLLVTLTALFSGGAMASSLSQQQLPVYKDGARWALSQSSFKCTFSNGATASNTYLSKLIELSNSGEVNASGPQPALTLTYSVYGRETKMEFTSSDDYKTIERVNLTFSEFSFGQANVGTLVSPKFEKQLIKSNKETGVCR